MRIQRKILLYMGRYFGFSPSEKLTVCHFIRCIFTFSEKEISGKKEKTEEKNEFSVEGADRARKKIRKIFAGKKTAGNKEKGKNPGKSKFFRKIDREKRFLEKERKRQGKSGQFQEKRRSRMMGRNRPDGGRMAGIFRIFRKGRRKSRKGRRKSRISDFSHRKRHPAGCLFFYVSV